MTEEVSELVIERSVPSVAKVSESVGVASNS